MNIIIGKPDRRTDFTENHIMDITGFEGDDFKDVAAVLVYMEHYFIMEQKDGQFWTIAERTECLGTLAQCERLLAEFVRGECAGAVMPFERQTAPFHIQGDEATFLCTWDGDHIEVHTNESLQTAYKDTNLFDEAEWFNVYGSGWASETIKVDALMATVEVGDAFRCDNCTIQRII